MKTKGKGKGKSKGQKAKRTCYECGSEEHLADKCKIRIDRVAAGGPERLDKPDAQMGSGGSKKGAGKAEKGGKGKVGIWIKEGDHGGTWLPSRNQMKGAYGGFPYPTIHQFIGTAKGMQIG